ncbi:MAG: histidinol-phosphatase [Actinobacteria bacterium]|nr:histidinol-phosphatase [Actinomycetota bacterium]MBV8961259.1 histidinol-phosphatase [Actinomycetota bacterium]MBV9254395.1 histidinol-phosphatase [Actinomycetota bacterium]MBV9663381.1 histidinol-phosphatase [Actinomycetota bacterium]MBV9936331.1 histidinol-phosphatase [Actinomycetota bacterium]
MNEDLELALELADIADTITAASFRDRDLKIESKPDMSLVSAADRAAEETIRAHLSNVRPNDGVLGEEFGEAAGTSGLRWVLDPIDGTHNYVRGIPVWASLIAAERDGVGVVGVVSAPALGRRWYAAKGEGAFIANASADGAPDDPGERIRVSGVTSLADAQLSSGWERMLFSTRYQALAKQCWRVRGFGDFWSLLLVAEGAVDIAIEPGYHWDLVAPNLIVEEAGGRVTSMDGGASLPAEHALATNGHLHDEVLKVLGK